MGPKSSKSSYNVAPAESTPQQGFAPVIGQSRAAQAPAAQAAPETAPETAPQAAPETNPQAAPEAAPRAASKAPPAEAEAAAAVAATKMVPSWINESHFVEILKENVPNFSKIQNFRIKSALGAGENYATLMLRVNIDMELTDKTTKPISLMMKVPHESTEMQQLLAIGNFFITENEAYLDFLPKLEALYKAKGLDVTLAPRAYQFKEGVKDEPRLANTVLMYDLGQDGYRNINRMECLNFEQTKMVLKKMAQYHAAGAQLKSLLGSLPDSLLYGMFGSDPQKALAMTEAIMVPAQNTFLNNLKNYKNAEIYREKLEKYFATSLAMFTDLAKPDPSEFNTILHGDCWVNNFLFKLGPNGELLNMLFVDFQNPRYSHPAGDLLYFIMTSVHIDYKLKDFEYFIKYYHDELIEHLKLLDYKERLPKLQEFQVQMYKYGSMAVTAALLVLPIVLLDPTETATFENFFGTGEGANDFKALMYSGKRYITYIEQILPWLDNRGILEPYESPAKKATPAAPTEPKVNKPDWVQSDLFKDLLKNEKSDFKEIQDFRIKETSKAGEDPTLDIDIDYQTLSGETSTVAYTLKVPSKEISDVVSKFKKELAMYNDVIPQLEQLYQEAGQSVTIAPKSYKFDKSPDCDHLLLQSLQSEGYKNADYLQGLTKTETEQVLIKLAKLHAASAHLYATKGNYADCLDKPVFNDALRPKYESSEAKKYIQISNEAVKTYENSDEYAHKVIYYNENAFNLTAKAEEYDKSQFNCLNHGDCWTNNIMFAYGAQGEIKDTLLIDFQGASFGSPARDLYNLLLTSPNLDIKIEQFDYFVRFYHDELKTNLELLKYPKEIPTVRDIHNILLQNPLWAISTVATVMPAMFLDSTVNDSSTIFQNPKYRKHAEALYPWLNHRGLLDFDDAAASPIDDCYLNWLDYNDFTSIIATEEPQFERIVGGTTALATKPGDNYASKLLKIDIEYELKDKSRKSHSYVLKTNSGDLADSFNFFPKETEMYGKFVPAFEQLYKDAGLSIAFSPKTYKFNKTIEADYLLMDNLNASGFSMINRLQGLNLEHTKLVLQKLAQWHAASLKYKEINGPYPEKYDNGIINENTREIFKTIIEKSKEGFLKIKPTFENIAEYEHKLETILDVYVDKYIESAQIDEHEFNVLNHGDLWINNILFKQDENGNALDTYLIDHQDSKYGSPAQDLFYFILTSSQLNIKIDQFDYLIRWYHENLVEHAKILEFNGFIPDLKELHILLLQRPVLAVSVVFGTLTLCLTEPKEELSADLFMADGPAGEALYAELYGNERFKAHFERIMPWLNRRGMLDLV